MGLSELESEVLAKTGDGFSRSARLNAPGGSWELGVGARTQKEAIGSRTSDRAIVLLLAACLALCAMLGMPQVAGADQGSFAYRHSPLYNPKAMADIVENPDAVYGFSPNPDSGSLTAYATYDWTDPAVVAQAHESRREYLEQDQQIYELVEKMEAEGASVKAIARAASARRNELRLEAYKDDPEGLAKVKARNLEQYGNEDGPTPKWLYEKYGSWEIVLDNAFNTNPGMDACCGFYDDNWDKYIHFGQIPSCTVSFDAGGHGEAPEAQSVWAGEPATAPADPSAQGWTFSGWYAEGSERAYDFTAPVASDITLVASWEQDASPAPDSVADDGAVSEEAGGASTAHGASPASANSQRPGTLPDTGDTASLAPIGCLLSLSTVLAAAALASRPRKPSSRR